ncbi:hypothetical protein FACS189483_09380 [Spirochaetia bacterium]|nr:hypothetical protein FACS189483_09380 [Spirochaetia bacterium]
MKRIIGICAAAFSLFILSCSSPLEGFGVKPLAPAAPIITATDIGSLTISWDAVELAESYNIYYGTSQTPPEKPAQTTKSTSITITGLVDDTTYYVWVQALNIRGGSPLSNTVSGKTPITHTVSYNENGASGTPPAAQTTLSGTSVTIAGQGSLTYSGKVFIG